MPIETVLYTLPSTSVIVSVGQDDAAAGVTAADAAEAAELPTAFVATTLVGEPAAVAVI